MTSTARGDRRFNRDIAIKVLPDEFSRDGQRVARFERETQALAALNRYRPMRCRTVHVVDVRHLA